MAFIYQSIETGNLIQFWTDEKIQKDAWQTMKKFKDHKLSLTDATTMVIMERFKVYTILTLDSDFVKVGLDVLPKV